MHIQHAITPTQRRLMDERRERLQRLGAPKPKSVQPVPKPVRCPLKHYRLACEFWPEWVAATKRRKRKLSMKAIIAEVAEKHGFTPLDIRSPRREVALVKARHEAMWRARQETEFSYPKISRFFKRDHTSTMHGIRKHEERMAQQAASHDPKANISRYIAKALPLASTAVQNNNIRINNHSN